MIHLLLNCQMEAFRGQKRIGTQAVEATQFNFEVVCNLRGLFEAKNGKKTEQKDICTKRRSKTASNYVAQWGRCWTVEQEVQGSFLVLGETSFLPFLYRYQGY